jgi:type II secretory pathway component PulF
MFGARASLKYLAGLCRRLSIELASGIDVRKTWTRELDRAPWNARTRIEAVRAGVSDGDTMTDALQRTGEFFPPLFRKLVEVGEETGHSAEVFRRLAENYDHQLQLRRSFLQSITWPMLQLIISLTVVGILIFAMGVIQEMTGTRVDILGFGLVGMSGLIWYLTFLGWIVLAIVIVVQAIRRGAVWVAPVQQFVMRSPGIGPPLRTLSLSRFAWSLHLTLDAGMEIRKAITLSLQTTYNAYYTAHNDQMVQDITLGQELNEAMARTRVFPPEFVDAIEVGERSGRLVETLAILSKQLQEQATAALATLTKIAGFIVWLIVAVLIIMLIFRIFGFYAGVLNEATKM